MNFEKATNEQLKVILEQDVGIAPHLIQGAFEEAVKRDLYAKYFIWTLNRKYKAINYAKHLLKMDLNEIKNMLYYEGFNALKYYKPGKYHFFGFWNRFIHTALHQQKRIYEQEKRQAEIVSIDKIQIVDDKNVERKVLNKITVEKLLDELSPEDKRIVLLKTNNYTSKEIAAELGGSRHRIDRRYKNAIKTMRGVVLA